ncbi:MAG TPA: hypothetical protein VHC00_03805 [Rhizobiaceae bacterium]|nr:hypothetical protein [Rhizobiaceae bacterium]
MLRRYGLLLFVLIVCLLLLRSVLQSNGIWMAVKPALIPIVSLYLSIFNSPAAALVLCLLMVVLAAVLFTFYFVRRISPTLRDLNVVCSHLRTIDPRLGNPSAAAQLNEAMERYDRFRDAWHLYRTTFTEDAKGRLESPYPPAQYFNLQMLERQGMRLRFFLGLPNDFVGLGLVFTFLGLVAGLYFASRSMMSADISEARTALTELLHAATFKFLTSIVGIAISLVMSAAQRILLEKILGRLNELQFLIEERLSAPSTQAHGTPRGEAWSPLGAIPAPSDESEPLSRHVGHG